MATTDAAVNDDTTANAESRARYREKLAYDVDFDLDMVLDLVFGFENEATESSIGLTLVTTGGVIEGSVVHQTVVEESQIEAVEPSSETMATYLRIVQEKRKEALAKRKASQQADEPSANREYVHFAEATVTNGNARMELQNLKVSLKSVIAWSLGYKSN